MPRFAVLTHDHPYLHWDFLLEAGGALRAWRLAAPPAHAIDATALPDHRLMYLDYEGPVGGGRGTVTRWDGGTYAVERWGPERIELILDGDQICGPIRLVHIDGTEWRLEHGA